MISAFNTDPFHPRTSPEVCFVLWQRSQWKVNNFFAVCTCSMSALAGCFRIFVLDHSPILLREDVSATVLGATGTGLFSLFIKLVAIIKGQFLACFDVPQRHNPDGTGGRVDFTIRIAGMVDIAGFISEHLAVDIPVVVKGKN